jgi:hypothetical protein
LSGSFRGKTAKPAKNSKQLFIAGFLAKISNPLEGFSHEFLSKEATARDPDFEKDQGRG